MSHVDIIENDFKDWEILKVISQETINNNIYYTIIDKEGYKYFCQYDVIRNSRKRNLKLNKFFRGNKYTQDNINNYFKINNIEINIKYFNVNTATEKIIFQCKKQKLLSYLLNGKFYKP